MEKSILQVENTNSLDFKNEILEGVKLLLQKAANSTASPDVDKLLTREETAEMLSISLVTLWEWTRKDLIPAYRIGSKVRYKKGEILNALEKHNKIN